MLVTDRNGQASTEAGWNNTHNTNANDHLLEAEAIASDMMDPEAGIWFGLGEDGSSAPADDALGALPYGQYTLEELPARPMRGYELITKTFWVEARLWGGRGRLDDARRQGGAEDRDAGG